MARQTYLQVTSPELTFFLLLSFSGPQTILTVFGHSIWFQISLKFVPKGPVDNKPALVQIMAWLANSRQAIVWKNADPVHDAYMRHWGGDELTLVVLHDNIMAWDICRITGPLWGESIAHWWIPLHDDVIKWKHFPHYWLFVWANNPSPVNSPHKGQWHGSLMLSLLCTWTNDWANKRDTGDLRYHRAHYDIPVMTNGQ